MATRTRKLAYALVITCVLFAGSGQATAQYVVHRPVVSYYYTPPTVTYYTPPVVYRPAYVSHYYTPTVTYYPAAPVTTYYAAPAVAPVGVTTVRYGLFGLRRATYYHSPVYVYP